MTVNIAINMPAGRAALAFVLTFSLALHFSLNISPAHASEIHRCAENGRITYSDRPCMHGESRPLRVHTHEPGAADRKAAAERLRQDKQRLKNLEMQRAADERALSAEAAERRRLKTLRAREKRICVRLEQRVLKTREQARGHVEVNRGKERDALLKKLEKLEDDYALQCAAG